MSKDTQVFIDWVHETMRRQRWNYSDFARTIDTSVSVVTRWMEGSTPSMESILKVANRTGMDPVDLLRMVGHLPPAADADDLDPVRAAVIARLRLPHLAITDDRANTLHVILDGWVQPPSER